MNDDLSEITSSFSTLNENKYIDLISYGSDKFDGKKKRIILMFLIKFIKVFQDLTSICYNYLSINVKRICVLFMCII